jgi:hypothetical protein
LGGVKKRREMLAHEPVEDGVLGGTRPVRVGVRGTRTLGMCDVEPNGRCGGPRAGRQEPSPQSRHRDGRDGPGD